MERYRLVCDGYMMHRVYDTIEEAEQVKEELTGYQEVKIRTEFKSVRELQDWFLEQANEILKGKGTLELIDRNDNPHYIQYIVKHNNKELFHDQQILHTDYGMYLNLGIVNAIASHINESAII